MMKRLVLLALALILVSVVSHRSLAFNILTPGDPIVAIDADFTIGSSSPGAEGAPQAIDGDANTKYLNFGVTNTGFIVTPAVASAVQSFILTTANDFPARDPASYRIWGTNSPITSTAHGDGRAENWTLISAGNLADALALPEARFAAGAPVGFTNATSYSSYKLTFPTVKAAANSMQVAEVAFFASNNGTGANLLTPGLPIVPIRDTDPTPSSNSPAGEAAGFAIDRNINTKYLNFGEERSGFIVTPSAGAFAVNGIQFTTANDAEARDPASYQLYGTNEAITTPNNGIGNEQNWTLVSSGNLTLPAGRLTDGPVIPVSGNTAYSSYRVIFPTVKDAAAANSMQVAEVRLFAADDGVLEVNRQTGNVSLRAINPITLTEYELRSLNSHALNDANWTSITSTNADPNDTWLKTSAPGATNVLSEKDGPTGANNGFTIAAGSTYNFGNIWGKVPSQFADLTARFLKLGGGAAGVGVEYIGTEIPLGDYSGNGTIGPEDWTTFRAGYGGSYAGKTAYEAYIGGDLDGDFDSDVYDFNIFVQAAGGLGALFGSNVPEPSSFGLLFVLLAMGWSTVRVRFSRPAKLVVCSAMVTVLASSTADAQTFTNVGGVPIAITIPAGQQNETIFSGPGNLFDDDVLDDPGAIDGELFLLNYNDANITCAGGDCLQYAGLGSAPKVVFMDYGTSVSANWFAYAQRSGGIATADRVGKFEFWFSNTPLGGVLQDTAPDSVVQLLPSDNRLTDSVLRPYTLSGTRSGRYVAMRLNVSEISAGETATNIGGHEFRLLSGPSDVVLQVNRATGAMTLSNNLAGAQAIDIKSYTIESGTGALKVAGFNGLRGDSAAFPAGNGSGNGWEIGGGSNASRLAEAYFSGTSTLAIGAAGLPLGNAYNELTLAEDLIFTWTNSAGETYNARVVYAGVAPDILPGDYNNNHIVDAADYTRWRDALGTNTVLPNDTTPGTVDQSDYLLWKGNFGNAGAGSLAPTGAAVPEPASLSIVVLMCVGFGFTRTRTRAR